MGTVKTVERLCPNCGGGDFIPHARGRDFEYKTCDNEFKMVRCAACDLVFLNPTLDPGELDVVYPPEYEPFHFNTNKNWIYRLRSALKAKNAQYLRDLLPDGARILDVGCGDGEYLTNLERINSSWELEGIDFGETAVKLARSQGLQVVQGNYENVDLGENRYDLIILNQVIEHFSEPQKVVEKIARELKPGGYANIETPCLDGWDHHLFKNQYWGGYHFPRHLVLFSEATIRRFMASRGFETIRVRYMASPVFWVFSLHHLWENCVGPGASFWGTRNFAALGAATLMDMIQRLVRGKTSNMQVVARKRNSDGEL